MPRTTLLGLSAATLFLGAACSSATEPAVAHVGATSAGLAATPLRGSFGPTASRGGGGGGGGGSAAARGLGAPFRTSRHDVKSRVTSLTPDAGLALPHWVGSFNYQGTTFQYAVVGADPALGQTTTIPAVVVPYRLVFADGTILDATTDLIDGVTPLDGVMGSPVFQPAPFAVGGTSLGTTQWGDAVLRANFWDRRPKGDGYHVLLAPTVLPVVTIQVPANHGTTALDPGTGRRTALLDFQWAHDLFVTEMAALGVTPDKVAIHLLSEVGLSKFNGSRPIGYHFSEDLGALTGVAGNQTYIETSYFGKGSIEDQGDLTGVGTEVLGHEIAEWLNDPNGQNSVPAWQLPDRPHVCYSPILEVGDPIEEEPNAVLQVPSNGRVYNFPDVAFTSYFSRAATSHSVNGWRTLLNTFKTPSIPCSYAYFYGWLVGFTDASGAPDPTTLTGVNDAHGAVGYFQDGGFYYGVRFDGYDPVHANNGTASSLAVPVAGQPGYIWETFPTGIANDGSTVGYFFDSLGAHGFVEKSGQFTTIDVPGATATYVLGTNNRAHSDVVGQYFDAQSVSHGFVLRNGKLTTVDAPFGVNTAINAINDRRQIVGVYDSGGPQGGFEASLRNDDADHADDRGSAFVAVNYPANGIAAVSVSTQLTGVSNAGEVIGFVTFQFADGSSVTRGTDIVDGNFQTLGGGVDGNDAYVTVPNAINASGIIVGTTTDHYGTQGMAWMPASALQASVAVTPTSGALARPANMAGLTVLR